MTNPFENKSNAYWADGEACVSEGYWNPAAHSLYYAVFQAVYGFAERKNLLKQYRKPSYNATDNTNRTPTEHEVVRKIVKAWKGASSHDALRKLYAARIKADYRADDVTEPEISTCMSDAGSIREYFINLKT